MVSEVIAEIQELTAVNKKGVEALYEAEIALAKCEADLDKLETQTLLAATGSVAEKQATAKLESVEVRFQRDLAKAVVGRVRAKLRSVESALMAQATMAKLLQAEMKL
jgi:hypothetical protein